MPGKKYTAKNALTPKNRKQQMVDSKTWYNLKLLERD